MTLPVFPALQIFSIPGGVTVERVDDAGWTVDGDPDFGNPYPITVCPAIIQPATGRDLLRLPEGDRSLETVIFHSPIPIRTAREASRQAADRLCFREPTPTAAGLLEGKYVVVTAADWQVQAGFTRCICQREESDAA